MGVTAMKINPALILLLCFLLVAMGQLPSLKYSKVMDTQGSVILRWDFNKTTEEITLELEVATTGWIGLGLSPNGGMKGADIVIGGKSANGANYFKDYHGIGNEAPVEDAVQNCNLLSLSENGARTTMRFSRKFRTCDTDDMDITENTHRVIAAYGAYDTIQYHGVNHFTQSIRLLLEASTPADAAPNISLSSDIKMTNFPVPSAETTYGCAFLPLPAVSTKHHIYKYEANIQSGNEDLIHHVLLYSCPNFTNISASPGACNGVGDNSSFYECSQVLAAWAIGAGPFILTNDAGISLGTAADPTYVRIEIHYNNHNKQSGRVDNSGIRLHYTPNLRLYDVGILEMGSLAYDAMFIPPNSTSYKVYGVCKTGSFNQISGQAVPDMQVFASFLHTHLAGTAIQIAHYRNGTQIGFLGRDMTYDFNLQEEQYLPSVIPLKMGDELLLECTYNTASRTNVTFGGLSTMHEMCLGFLNYYPRNNISSCFSIANPASVSSALGIDARQFPDNLNTLSWTLANIQKAQTATKDALHATIIIHVNTVQFWSYGAVRNITEPALLPCTNLSTTPSTSLTAPLSTTPSTSLSTNLSTTPSNTLINVTNAGTCQSFTYFLLCLPLLLSAGVWKSVTLWIF